MPSNIFYPKLSQVISIESLPAPISKIDGLVDALIDGLFYNNLQFAKSPDGDAAFYRLELVMYKKLGFEIPGAEGMELLFNPNLTEGTGDSTVIPITARYRWEVLKYAKSIRTTNFSGDPSVVFILVREVLDIRDKDLLRGAISVFLDATDPEQSFVDHYNLSRTPSTPLTLNSGASSNIYNDLAIQIRNNSDTIFASVFEEYIVNGGTNEAVQKMKDLFNLWVDDIDFNEILGKLLIPRASVDIEAITIALLFPRKIFQPLDINDAVIPDESVRSALKFDVGSLGFDSETGFRFRGEENFNFQKSMILNSGFTLELNDMRLDLSRTSNIPEADADGRPAEFIGAYITYGAIGFPAFWKQDDGASTGVITARNLLVGTGGISGTIGLEAKTNGNQAPLIAATFGEAFTVSLDTFALEFQQNAIIGSEIGGTMKIPGFKDATGADAVLDIDVHIGQDGEFSVTVTEEDGFELEIPDAINLLIKSASVGREDDRFYLSVSGKLKIISPGLEKALGAPIEFQEIIIWDDGQYEIKGGGLELPKAIELGGEDMPFSLSITSIHLGSEEREYYISATNSVLRNYKYFGFDGALKVGEGAVDAKGQGVKFYFSEDKDYNGRHFFMRIESLEIDLMFPGDATPKTAQTLINGFLSIKDAPAGIPGSEYAGGVDIKMPQTGAGGAVRMRFNPKVPYFIIDAEIEPKKSIPLGNTGMGIYGFRGLVGKHFVASKEEAGVQPEQPWWEYYKAKVPDQHREGVQIGKFAPTGGFAIGLGVSLATNTDGGKVFSSKIFLLLSLRELIMLQGQAAILSERIQLNDPNDPPFFALIVITRESIEAALGVNYLIPDDKSDPGDIATVQGVLELGFFFKDASAWYLNIGRDLPESYRIQVRALDLFDCYFYFMLNAKGIRTGAGASFEAEIEKGPLYAHLWAYLDIAAKVAFKPKQFGGSIQLGGGIDISIFGLGFGISAAAGLAAEAPEPFNVSGFVKACFKAMGKEWCAEFEFSWEFNQTIDRTAIGVINSGAQGLASIGQAVNIQTKEIFPVQVSESGGNTPPNPSSWGASFDDYVIPMDSFIDLDFTNGMNPFGNTSTEKFGTLSGGANHFKSVAPQKGKSPQVHHSFHVEEIYVRYWNGSSWVDYEIYEAMTEWADPQLTFQQPYSNFDLKQGYWQAESPNQYNKLRVLAQNPLSFTTQSTRAFVPENSGITSQSIFCDPEERVKSCINFADYIPTRKAESTDYTGDFTLTGLPPAGNVSSLQMYNNAYPTQFLGAIDSGSLYTFGEVAFVVNSGNAGIVTAPQALGNNAIGMGMLENNALEINFNEPMVCIDYGLTTYTNEIIVEFYRIVVDPNASGNNLIAELITSVTHSQATVNASEQQYLDDANPVDKMIIRSGVNPEGESFGTLCEPELTLEGEHLEAFFHTLVSNDQLSSASFQLNDEDNRDTYDTLFMNSPLYQWHGGGAFPALMYTSGIKDSVLSININDGNHYNCTFELIGSGRFDWTTVEGFTNLRKDPQYSGAGPNKHFLIDAQLSGGGIQVISASSTCHNVLNCYDNLSTWVFNICHLSAEDYAFNQTIMSSAQTTSQVGSMMDAMQHTIQPIWRPFTKYAVTMVVREDISGTTPETNTYHVGFSTAGPIGHFHKYLDGSTEVIREDYQKLLDKDQEESYVLSSLKPYVNYRKSYPNANGDLLNAKPLFYLDPKINLFFNNPYVYHMFDDWYQSDGTTVHRYSSMEVEIVDPAPYGVGPDSTVRWQRDQNPIQGSDSQMLNNMISNADPSGCEPDQLNEFGVMAEIEVANLKPLKLYTAKIKNKFGENGDQTDLSRDVLKYPFRTSQYPNFEAQIGSYILAEDENQVPVKTAIYDVAVDQTLDLTEAVEIIGGDPIYQKEYADTIERILQGVLKIGTLQPAISTEFNFLKYGNTILGVWIRNPEPFNDPKIPQNDLALTVDLAIDGAGSFNTYISKDVREIFITNTGMNLPTGAFEFRFRYLQWDKTSMTYTATDTQVVNHTVPPTI